MHRLVQAAVVHLDADPGQLRRRLLHGGLLVVGELARLVPALGADEGAFFLAQDGHLHRLVVVPAARWDGQGYPDGLAGTAIPLLARIFAWAPDQARRYIQEQAGSQFDPAVAAAFLRLPASP